MNEGSSGQQITTSDTVQMSSSETPVHERVNGKREMEVSQEGDWGLSEGMEMKAKESWNIEIHQMKDRSKRQDRRLRRLLGLKRRLSSSFYPQEENQSSLPWGSCF